MRVPENVTIVLCHRRSSSEFFGGGFVDFKGVSVALPVPSFWGCDNAAKICDLQLILWSICDVFIADWWHSTPVSVTASGRVGPLCAHLFHIISLLIMWRVAQPRLVSHCILSKVINVSSTVALDIVCTVAVVRIVARCWGLTLSVWVLATAEAPYPVEH